MEFTVSSIWVAGADLSDLPYLPSPGLLVFAAFLAAAGCFFFFAARKKGFSVWELGRVAAAMGLESVGDSRMFGALAGRHVEVERQPFGVCTVKVWLSDAWGQSHRARATPWLENQLALIRGENPSLRFTGGMVLRTQSRWPSSSGEHFGGLALLETLEKTTAVANTLDVTLAQGVQEWESRERDFVRLGLRPAGDDGLAGRPDGCDVALVKRDKGKAATWRLEAPLGPGWPRELVLDRAVFRAGFRSVSRRTDSPIALPRPFELCGFPPERIERLFARGEPDFSSSLRCVCSAFPDARIENGFLTLTLERWDARVAAIAQRLGVVTAFLEQVQRHTDWPERRRTRVASSVVAAPS